MFALCDNGALFDLSKGYDYEWWCETDIITSYSANIKHINKIQMLVEIDTKSWLCVEIIYVNGGTLRVYDSREQGDIGLVTVRVVPRQTADYGFKLRLTGFGQVKVFFAELVMSGGGDLVVGSREAYGGNCEGTKTGQNS